MFKPSVTALLAEYVLQKFKIFCNDYCVISFVPFNTKPVFLKTGCLDKTKPLLKGSGCLRNKLKARSYLYRRN